MITINNDGDFTKRPFIGERFQGPEQTVHAVASIWSRGVVFEQGPAVSAADLVTQYKPECPICCGFHEPEYPHEFNEHFRFVVAMSEKRPARRADSYAHCTGLIKASAERAHQPEEV